MPGNIEKWLVQLNRLAVGILAIAMFALVIINVFSRYFFSYSFTWAEELASIIMMWVAFLGMGLAMREGQIVAIETLLEYLPKRAETIVRTLVAVIVLIFMGILAWLGFQYSNATIRQLSASLRWPLGLIYLAIPIGSILFILHFLAVLRNAVSGSLKSAELADPDDEEFGGGSDG
jgi:TRAP-type C4-dicarboxylate transport system permease small subunit